MEEPGFITFDYSKESNSTFITIMNDENYLAFTVGFNKGDEAAIRSLVNQYFPIECEQAMVCICRCSGIIRSELFDVPILARQLPGYERMVRHPMQDNSIYYLGDIIMSLNDSYKWTREQIADWIETLDDIPVFTERIEDAKEKFPAPTILASFKSIL